MPKSITGGMFRKMIIAGANTLEDNKQYVDSLNVFPVPDGDTGTNMSLTMRSALKEVNMCANNNIDVLADALSKGALKGARGNSGVILSQILKGFTTCISKEKTITIKKFAEALKCGADIAYKAVTKPKEGTILTVIRVMSEESVKIAKKVDTMEEFMRQTLEAGENILQQTPEMLPVLKKAGVVDAGGRGLLVILSGFYKVITGDTKDIIFEQPEQSADDSQLQVDYNDLADIEFAYCTEFFIINLNKKTTEADIDKLREKLMEIGDSVICIGDLNLVKVHVHTNEPGVAISNALQLGEVNGVKIENMLEQNRALKVKQEHEELKAIGMVSICAGTGLASIFKDLMVDYVIEGGQTMNPSAEDIAKACDNVAAETVFVLPNNKNIILASELAKDLSRRNIEIIPTISVPEGITACLNFNMEDTADANKQNMTESLKMVKSGSVTYAVRSTHIDGLKLKEGDIIGLDESKIIAKGESVEQVVIDTISTMITPESMHCTLFFGSDLKQEDAEKAKVALQNKFPELEFDVHDGGQPLYYYLISIE